jgi:hypothetical protein
MIVFRLLKHLDRMLKLESLKEELSSVKSKPPRREAAAEEAQQRSLIWLGVLEFPRFKHTAAAVHWMLSKQQEEWTLVIK